MSNSTPEIPGYQFDQRILLHPLAELWHGRTFTGTDVIALVLSDEGARNEVVVDRLARDAAIEPGRTDPALWAVNFNAPRPYAITQLVHGRTGAERLVDPLDGVLGNDEESLAAVRAQLIGYGATPPTLLPGDAGHQSIPTYAAPPHSTAPQEDNPHESAQRPSTGQQPTQQPTQQLTQQPTQPYADLPTYTDHPEPPQAPQPDPHTAETQQQQLSKLEIARQYRHKIGAWVYAVVAVVVVLVFTIAYSIGTAIGGAVKQEEPEAAPPAAVSPEPIASPVLLQPIERVTTAPYKRPDGSAGVFGASYAANADVQVVANAELPFAVGWPRPPEVGFLGESSQVILRRIATKNDYAPGGLKNSMQAQIALHPCAGLAQCVADRPAFDQLWTKIFKAPPPATAKDARTWLTVSAKAPYTITMTRAFFSGGQWWLVGAMVHGQPAEAPDIQRVVNDIWRQTS